MPLGLQTTLLSVTIVAFGRLLDVNGLYMCLQLRWEHSW